MSIRLYLTVAAVMAILCALAFLVIPVQASLFFSDFAEARSVLYLRFCGAAVLAWGLMSVVRQGLSGLVLDPLGSDCQRRGSRDQYHNKLRCDYAGLAEWQRLGINCIALFAVARWDLSPRDWRNGLALRNRRPALRRPAQLLQGREVERGMGSGRECCRSGLRHEVIWVSAGAPAPALLAICRFPPCGNNP